MLTHRESAEGSRSGTPSKDRYARLYVERSLVDDVQNRICPANVSINAGRRAVAGAAISEVIQIRSLEVCAPASADYKFSAAERRVGKADPRPGNRGAGITRPKAVNTTWPKY